MTTVDDLLTNADRAEGTPMTPHGTRSTYNHSGCRCDPCKAATRDYKRQQRTIHRNLEPPANTHGTASTYSNWGCRCDQCKQAMSDANRADYQRRKAAR